MKNYLTRKNDGLGFNFFEDAFNDLFKPTFYRGNECMPTDIKENENDYELSIGLAGYEKKDLNVSLNDGYLTVSAKKEETDSGKNYLRRERSFSCSRSYYVGDDVKEDDIKAKYTNGVLYLTIPKNDNKKIERKNIEIE